MVEDEDLLLELLNSAPVVDGARTDQLPGAIGRELVARHGGAGSTAELDWLRRTREAVQGLVRGHEGAEGLLAEVLDGVVLAPRLVGDGIDWELRAPRDRRLAARAALAWSRVNTRLPGRLRACANTECNLYLIDHSRPGTARWCSMATCGNRMKARAHASRRRQDGAG